MVKTLHPIDDIHARVAQSAAAQLPLLSAASAEAAQNGREHLQKLDADGTSIDPVSAVMSALSMPLEFPPLADGIVPGDRVAIALDESIPCAGRIVRGAVQAFEKAGVDSQMISIVTSDAECGRVCRDEFVGDESRSPQIVVHDPRDEDQLCLVGATKRGEPLLVNRTIFDADVVLPIGCARPHSRGAYETLFPRFSNTAALERFRTPATRGSEKTESARKRETNEAGWLIGVAMVVEVVPGEGETVAQVVAGEPQAVSAKSEELSRERWAFEIPQRASLVIATISGGAAAQRWENVARALATAEAIVEESGAVAICTNLDEPPGESLGQLISSSDLEAAERKISHDHSDDTEAAWELARALQRGPVYFMSQLDSATVEDLGLAPVSDIDELVRLAGRHESVVVVDDSQHAVVTVAGETNDR